MVHLVHGPVLPRNHAGNGFNACAGCPECPECPSGYIHHYQLEGKMIAAIVTITSIYTGIVAASWVLARWAVLLGISPDPAPAGGTAS